MKRPRYKVATYTGWPVYGGAVGTGSQLGCTASVLDTLNVHREVKRFRSEERLPIHGNVRRGIKAAKRAVQEYADKLNAEHERG